MSSLYEQFGARLRFQREKKRMSQQDVADMAGMKRATVASIESARQAVALHQAIAISQALELDLGMLIADINQEASSELALERSLEAHDLDIIRELRDGLKP